MTDELAVAATDTLEVLAEQVGRLQATHLMGLMVLVRQSTEASEWVAELDLELRALVGADEQQRREGQQKIWELTKALDAEKGQHEALLSRKRSLSTAVTALEQQRDDLLKREAQARAAFQRAHRAAGREHHGKVSAQRALERVRTATMMLQVQVQEVVAALGQVASEVDLAACPQCNNLPTSAIVEVDLGLPLDPTNVDTLTLLTAEATGVILPVDGSAGWQDSEANRDMIVQHLASVTGIEASRFRVVRIHRKGSDASALVLIDLQQRGTPPERGVGTFDPAESISRWSAARVLQRLWKLPLGAGGATFPNVNAKVMCWEGSDGSFTVTTRSRSGAGGDPELSMESEAGHGAKLLALKRVEDLVQSLLDRVACPLRAPGKHRSDTTQSDNSESEGVSQDDGCLWSIERDDIGNGYLQQMSGLDYFVCSDNQMTEEGDPHSNVAAQGELVMRDHRILYEVAAVESPVSLRGAEAQSGWIEQRLSGLTQSASNTPKAAATSGEETSGVIEEQALWVTFGADEDKSEGVQGPPKADDVGAGLELSAWSAQKLASEADELTNILDAASVRGAQVEVPGEGAGSAGEVGEGARQPTSHVIEEPCVIPSVAASAQHSRGASVPRSSSGAQSAAHVNAQPDALPPSPSRREGVDGEEAGWEPAKANNDMPTFLSSSWASALAFAGVSPMREGESAPAGFASGDAVSPYSSATSYYLPRPRLDVGEGSNGSGSTPLAAGLEGSPGDFWGVRAAVSAHTRPVLSGVGGGDCSLEAALSLQNGECNRGGVASTGSDAAVADLAAGSIASFNLNYSFDSSSSTEEQEEGDPLALLSFVTPISLLDGILSESHPQIPGAPRGGSVQRSSSNGSSTHASSDVSGKLLDSMLRKSDLNWMVRRNDGARPSLEAAASEGEHKDLLRAQDEKIEAERDEVIREGGSSGFTAQWTARQLLKNKKRVALKAAQTPSSIIEERDVERGDRVEAPRQELADSQAQGDEALPSHETGSSSQAGENAHGGTFLSQSVLTAWAQDSKRERERDINEGGSILAGGECSSHHGRAPRVRPIGQRWMPADVGGGVERYGTRERAGMPGCDRSA